MSRGYITIAFGKQEYIDNAITLLESLRVSGSATPLALVTDRRPEDVPQFEHVVHVPSAATDGLLTKLTLDEYTPFDETIFIDSDCFVTRDPDPLWQRFENVSFGIVGGEIRDGSWYGADIVSLRARFGIEGPIPKFNSGLFYFSGDERSRRVFAESRRLWDSYEEIGLQSFRSHLERADEPLLSIAMAVAGVRVLPDDGQVMNTPLGLRGPLHLDLFRHECRFRKGRRPVSPVVAHFCGDWRKGGVYRREAEYLRRVVREGEDAARVHRDVRAKYVLPVLADSTPARAARSWARSITAKVLRRSDGEGFVDTATGA